ncbi:MAG: LysM domain-containing protein [Rhodanobacter sp.]|nr:MAG: LysM domain-containing protein [Rhodanobacter sp.]
MTFRPHPEATPREGKRLIAMAAWLLLLGVAGCAQVDKLKTRVSDSLGPHRTVKFTPAPQPAETRGPTGNSLAGIVNNQLEHGHYTEGEKALRRYLTQHPDDRTAKSLLQQLLVDPVRQLGSQWLPHQVQPGDSYSSLAARYLGDSGRFLILARYNGSTNPSILRVGRILRLPVSGQHDSTPTENANAKRAATVAATTTGSAEVSASSADSRPDSEPAKARAERLQGESVALLKHGRRQQALAKLDQALTVDPQLKPAEAAVALRKQLVSSYHQRAIVLYRDQHLNQAIALWDHVLAIDPQFEPAVIYRARARELKRRLRQL